MEEMIAEVKGHMDPPASIAMERNKKEPTENYVWQDSVDAKLQKRPGFFDSALLCISKKFQNGMLLLLVRNEPVPENLVTPEMKHDGLVHLNLEGSLSNKENMVANKIAEDSENYQLDSTNCGRNEEISPLDKENITPNVSGNIVMERSRIGLKSTISQGLMDSISPLNLDHDHFPVNENSMLKAGNQMKSNVPVFENLSPLTPVDKKMSEVPDGMDVN